MTNIQKSRCFLLLAPVLLIIALLGTYYYYYQHNQGNAVRYSVAQIDSKAHMPYLTNIVTQTEENTNFRKVLFTGTRSQLVVMSIPPGGDVGAETHTYTEQTLFFLSGTGEAILDGKTTPISAGDVVVVTPGTQHNFINTGTVPLKLYTVYAPPNHIDGTLEATKADADANVQDEAYGDEPK
jgi:mannose-6-phosphate isomerase-like protein (cupin superfamily)